MYQRYDCCTGLKCVYRATIHMRAGLLPEVAGSVGAKDTGRDGDAVAVASLP